MGFNSGFKGLNMSGAHRNTNKVCSYQIFKPRTPAVLGSSYSKFSMGLITATSNFGSYPFRL